MTFLANRGGAEGYFRWHWLLCDSLEAYCDLMGRRYPGPKNILQKMEKLDPAGYALYAKALKHLEKKTLNEWIEYLKNIAEQRL